MIRCRCGKVEVEQEGDRIVVGASGTKAILTIVRSPDGDPKVLKVEHLNCQFCQSVAI